jgi:hypothetical protein
MGDKMQDSERLLYNVHDLVKLGMGSKNTLYRLAGLDELPIPTILVGKKYYFSKLKVDSLLKGNGKTEEGAESQCQ